LNLQRVIKAVFVSVALISSVPMVAQASDWFIAASAQGGSQYFVDRDSIVRNGNNAKANLFVVFGTPTDEGTVGYTASSEFSCADRRYRDTQTTFLRNDGSTRHNNIADEWDTTKPDSVIEAVLQQACGY
jgi:hypothetical protein